MKKKLFIFGTFLLLLGALFYLKQTRSSSEHNITGLLAQNNYMGPDKKIPGNPYLVRIEVLIHDSPELGGVQIQQVVFDGREIPLKPRDIHGYRGTGSFQLPPGKYSLKWIVQRDKIIWPRTITHEEEVTIDQRDLWVQISIVGEEASIL